MNIINNFFTDYHYKNISGLTDELKCLYINEYFKNNDNSILLVCNTLFEANKLFQTIKNYNENSLLFPMDDFMTSELLAISPNLKINRLETINNLNNNKKNIVVTNLMGYLRFLPRKEKFFNSCISLEVSKEVDIKNLINKLYNIGYTKETIVNKTGEMAIRGFVLDIFPINSNNPIRIEFFGDEIESIRTFDINSQLTIEKISEIEITPNSEFIIDNLEDCDYKQRDLIKFGEVSSIQDYLNNCVTFYNDLDDLNKSYFNIQNEIIEYCESSNIPCDTNFMFDIKKLYKNNSINMCHSDIINNEEFINYQSFKIEEKFEKLESIIDILNKYLKQNKTIVICVSNRYQANKIIDNVTMENIYFTNIEEIIDNKINIIIKKINEGFIYKNYVFISENEIFNKVNNYTYKTKFKLGTRIKDISKLQIGDYVVHSSNGIGRYCGIKTISKNGLIKDYLQIEYKDNDKLYIPVEKIDLISKYSFNDGYIPKLNKLGTLEWEKTKLKARKRAHDIAQNLLNLYALRELKKGFKFNEDDENQIAFEKEFIYEETPDQLKVINEIKKDMESRYPMDRLLCGDVGYGKTEVAFRAAFKAILSGRQVALLCPTTILSSQHYKNALDRFKSFAVNIKLLNRYVTSKQFDDIKKDLKEGKIDFVIGTHKLLNKEIEFKSLGLLIVDEEQRFGVTHKERLKELKTDIDVLTLSATPIPRTLQMSLSGIRSLSTLDTPPSNRYPVQTYVLSYNKKIIKDAIYKELSRSGQVFILYNRIENMYEKLFELKQLLGDVKIECAHGKMSKNEIEDIMLKFTNKEFDILLCTTIIETGIDIPNVNTLIVMDAQLFGLSQLYQLRGRVGRTDKLAYCYLMYDQNKIINEIARKRLNAIKEFTELGSGLSIAMRDLSIRGAGDVLGSEQAGFVDSIGIELFMKLLKQEIEKIKGNEIYEEEDTKPLIEVNTSVSDSYVKEEDLKIEIHKKINEIDSYDKLILVQKELEDRFGKLSDELIIYMYEEWFEHLANKLKINKVKQTKDKIEIILDKEILDKVNGEYLFIEAMKINPKFKFKSLGKNLIIILEINKLEKHFIYYLIDLLNALENSLK